MHSCCSGLFSLVVILVLTYDRVEISGTGCMDFFFWHSKACIVTLLGEKEM